MLQAGKLNKRITLLKPVKGEDVGFGAETTWEEETVWAEFLRPRFASGAAAGSGDAVTITQGIRIRRRSVEKGWKVRYDGREYNVLHVDDSVPRETTLTTQEVQT